MFTVLITDKVLGGTSAHGLFRTLRRAQEIADMFTSPQAANYYDPELYEVKAASINKVE